MAQTHPAHGDYEDLNDLRHRISVLEERWSSRDVEKGMSGHATGGLNGSTSAALANMATYFSQGNQYRVANPGPLGLFSFGLTTALLQGYNTKWTEATTNNWVYAFALFFGGLVQLLAGMWEFYRNNVFGGTAFSSYGGFWLGYGIFGILASGGVLTGELPPHGTQMMLILWGILTFIFFIQTLAINIALMVLFSSLTTTFILLAVGQDNYPRVTKAGGYFGVWTALAAWYIATAELTNSVYRRKVIPLGVVNLATQEPSLTGVVRPDTL